jgi:DNA polymerase-3 subunit delta'
MPFRDLAGHRRQLELTARAAVRGSLPPSLIFAGPDGTGKRRAAIALAQLFNCASPAAEPSPDACGHCTPCRRILRGVHADVLLIEPGDSGSIKVDQARQAIERSAYRPFEGRRRVVVVDDAEAMEASAQNALLKTLEEPPAASTFVLVTSRPDMLLPTVLSRCQRIRFGRLAPADVASVLMRDHGFAESEAHAAALLADGSIGRALDGEGTAYAGAREAAMGMLTTLAAAADPRRRLAGAKALGADKVDREELGRRLRLVSSLLRDLGLLLSRADERSLANADLESGLRRLAGSFDGGRAVRAFSSVDRALAALDRLALLFGFFPGFTAVLGASAAGLLLLLHRPVRGLWVWCLWRLGYLGS